ncbi:MAG TPA: sterol desaturase family protein [Rhodothermales bacterium]|nr:sterol desaturase family protein [Rhodothermales bacterium]
MDYQIIYPILDAYGGPILLVVFVALLYLEYRHPLRRWVQGVFSRRLLTNIGVSVPAFIILRLALIPAEVAAGYWATEHHFGLLYLVALPGWLCAVLAFLLLDYVLYIWHWLSHNVPFLWRFHNVHHTDLDLGVSTAVRFHFGEMILSGLFRVVGVLLIGAGPVVVLVYEVVFEASVAFQHSNWRLPIRLERILNLFIITPRMHGIHHSIFREETDSNYTNLFNVWDRIHGTLRLDVPQEDITIGVPGYRDGYDLSLFGLLTLPFRHQKDYWKLPDGTHPTRHETGEKDHLAP